MVCMIASWFRTLKSLTQEDSLTTEPFQQIIQALSEDNQTFCTKSTADRIDGVGYLVCPFKRDQAPFRI